MKKSRDWILGAVALGLALTANVAFAQNTNPGVLPPGSTPHGHTYGEWSVLWWQWALGIPPDSNPLLDRIGDLCDVGQSGSVWFLAGNFGGPDVRRCTIPAGTSLFFPVINQFWVTTCVGEPRTKDGIRPLVAPFIDAADDLVVQVDGQPLQDLGRYRVESPLYCTPLDLFGVTSPEDLAQFCGPGVETAPDCSDLPNPGEHFGSYQGYGPGMSDGYWIMLAPLPAGEHTIRFAGTSGEFTLDITYHLTVIGQGTRP